MVRFSAWKWRSDEKQIKKRRASGGVFYPRWYAAGICLLLLIPMLFGMILFASELVMS